MTGNSISSNFPPDNEGTLTTKQHQLVAALLAGNSVVDAAALVGCGERTARRWLILPPVQRALHEARKEIVDQTVTQTITNLGKAMSTLLQVMEDVEAPHATRVRAAQIIYEHGLNLAGLSEVESRITEIEAMVKRSVR